MALENAYRRSVEFWKYTVSNVSDDWSRPTPCTDWNLTWLTFGGFGCQVAVD
jgi:hypothetical protein